MNTNCEWRKRYEAHLRSTEWRNLRKGMLRLRGPECEDCGCRSGRLELHHLTYDRLGHEWPSDLKILCVRCHARADREREERERKRRIEAAFGTWFEKKTGRPACCATEDDYADFLYWLEWKELEPF